MIKIDKLLNEPYFESEYIKDVFLNKSVSPSDVTLHTNQVSANSIAHLAEVQAKSNLRFLMTNNSRTTVDEASAELLINSLAKFIEDICLYKIYQDTSLRKIDKKPGSSGIMSMILLPLNRESYDRYPVEKKIQLIKDKSLETYPANRNVGILIDWLKENNQSKRSKS